MTSLRLRAACATAFTLLASFLPTTRAQTVVFNDTMGAGSSINSNPTAPAAPTVNKAAYQQLTAKTFNPNPPTIAAGHLRQGIVSTSSGFNHIQALFTQYPVTLANNGEYIELTVTFTTEGGIITAQTNSTLMFGLYNGSQVQPLAGGMNSTIATPVAGSAQNWIGYVSRLFFAGGSNGFFTRPAQASGGANNQDLLFQYLSGSTVGSTATSAIAAFTTGAQYTEVFRITRNSATVLNLVSTLYAGATPTGTPLYTQSVNSTSTLTSTYDALAMGFRATGSVASVMDVNSVKVVTTAATTIVPVISTQPFAQTKSVGEAVNLAVVASGGGAPSAALSYQWYKDNVAITLGENATAQSATLNFASGQLADTGNYKVVVTNVAGAMTSDTVLLTITDGAVPPSVVTDPTGNTILVGGSHTFNVLANGTAPLTYQWQFSNDGGANYTDIGGATGVSYAVSGATLAQAGRYRVVITNPQGSATSAAAVLVVNQAPQISVQPVGGTFGIGDPVTLSVTATGTPAPTYQWKKNGVNIAGATSASYSIASLSGTHTANYTVVITNSVGSVTSAIASIAVLSPSMGTTAVTPLNGSAGRNPDARLTITFNTAPSAGVSGFIRIHDASNDAVVDTIDLVAATTLRDALRVSSTLSTLNLPVQNKSIGGTTNFNYYPITISGNTATLYPRDGVLAVGKTYYVKIDAGVFVNSSGEAFAGIGDSTTWRFSTKPMQIGAGSTLLNVAADGSGDFDTVQGALDFIPSGNSTPRTVFIKAGSYFEEIVATNKNFISLVGENRATTTIVYPNNNTFNNVSGGIYHRSTFIASGVNNWVVTNLKFLNSTPQNGSQAEAFIFAGSGALTARNLITKCTFYSYQDTIQLNKQCYVSDSYIEGDVDFMWGDGPSFFENCDIKILRTGSYFTQIRNGTGNHGYVFRNCRFTAAAGITGTFFGRIDPNGFPNSEVVILDSVFGNATNNAFLSTANGASGSDYRGGWWLLNGTTTATPAANVHNWTYNIVDKDGVALTDPNGDTFTNMPTDATTLANFRDATWVLNTTWAGVVSGSWTPALLPKFLTQPLSQSVLFGTNVTLTVDVAAVPAATLQWRKGGVDLPGATSASYTINNANVGDSGDYTCVATNSVGAVTSATAVIVIADPAILSHPGNVTVNVGQPAAFTVSATGSSAVSYQWQKDLVDLPGATGASFSIDSVVAADAGSYRVVVTNLAGSATSNAATLTVVVIPPSITTHPAAQTVTAGTNVLFSVAASGSAPFTYQWRKDGVDLGGATGATLTLNGVTSADAAAYSVVVSNSSGSATSDAAALYVNSPANALVTFLNGHGIDPTNPANLALDPDNDGVNTLLEFLLGGDPTVANSGLLPVPSFVPGSPGSLVLDFNRRKATAGLTTGVESSGNIAAWTPAVDGAGGVVFLVAPLDADFDHVQVAIPTADPKLFARVTASAVLPPSIATAPVSLEVAPGGSALFSVVASGGGSLTYQWYRNGTAIAGATGSDYSIGVVTPADEGDFAVVVANGTGFVTSAAAHLSVTSVPAGARLALEGFATLGTGVTGGGTVNLAAPGANYVVIDANTVNAHTVLRNYLESATAYVIELKTDVDIGPLKNISAQPVLLPELVASGVGRIKVKSNKTLFSVHGATIRHGTLSIDNVSNVIIRNLKFRGLWEWDDITSGAYDQMGWDYVQVTNNAKNVWVDRCDFDKCYDGLVDITNGADLVTVSYCRFAGDVTGVVTTQINYLETLYQANPSNPAIAYYATRRGTQSVAQIIASELPQKKCSLVGAGDDAGAVDAPGGLCKLNVTFHHNRYANVTQRMPRMRFGNAHVYNIHIDNTGISSSAVSSNINAASLVENSYFLRVNTILASATGGKVQARNSWTDNGTTATQTIPNQNPADPAAWLFNQPADFAWADRTVLPYPYVLDAPEFTRNNPALIGTLAPANASDSIRVRAALLGVPVP